MIKGKGLEQRKEEKMYNPYYLNNVHCIIRYHLSIRARINRGQLDKDSG